MEMVFILLVDISYNRGSCAPPFQSELILKQLWQDLSGVLWVTNQVQITGHPMALRA